MAALRDAPAKRLGLEGFHPKLLTWNHPKDAQFAKHLALQTRLTGLCLLIAPPPGERPTCDLFSGGWPVQCSTHLSANCSGGGVV